MDVGERKIKKIEKYLHFENIYIYLQKIIEDDNYKKQLVVAT